MRSFLALISVALVVAVLAACGSSPDRRADGTLVGTMTTGPLSVVTIDGQERRMAPGARILTTNNTTITPNLVPPASRVRYRLDANGQVSAVWLLPPGQ